MSDVSRLPSFPRGALFGAGALVAFAIGIATLGRMTGPDQSMREVRQVARLDLRFQDRADGALAVFNADDGKQIDVIVPGSDNFVRATLRGLAQQRKREDEGPSVPFRLTRWADGRLTLDDPATSRHIELAAFGETNELAFAHILASNGPTL
jgi:putative photosynthetic complex assembly protein